jgi:Tn3 transposase DDE domain
VLAPGGSPTQLGDTLAHYGRILTLHILSYVGDEPYRREIKGMRNLQEGRHDLARTMFHGRKGELRHGYREGTEDQLGALGLILNAITLWNTVYLDCALTVAGAVTASSDPPVLRSERVFWPRPPVRGGTSGWATSSRRSGARQELASQCAYARARETISAQSARARWLQTAGNPPRAGVPAGCAAATPSPTGGSLTSRSR